MNATIKRRLLRELPPEEGSGPREWCALEVEIRDVGDGKRRLSICGAAGVIVKRAEAKREALEYWESFFEESPEELKHMGERFGRKFRTARGGARFVLDTDGEFHGLEVDHESDDGKWIYIGHSWGQIREEIARFFPEAMPYFKWHLNDMRPTQDGKSWGYEPLPPEVIAWVENLGKEN